MARKWTQDSYRMYLINHANVEVHDKVFRVVGGTDGLKTCSAADYLANHCGYTVLFVPLDKPKAG